MVKGILIGVWIAYTVLITFMVGSLALQNTEKEEIIKELQDGKKDNVVTSNDKY